ncbi:MAG: DUF3301 domain-containing protein [Rudaea sp.]
MLGLPEIAAVALVALAAWFVWDTLKARENANDAMRAACAARGLLFLDDTVSLRSVRAVRDEDGQLRLRRIYTFQYSDSGYDRRDGSLTLTAQRVTSLVLQDGVAPAASRDVR